MTSHQFDILVTGGTFITGRHEEILRSNGIIPHRLNELNATEDQLCEALSSMDGYILGGLEKVTPRVIDAAIKLQAICFTGAAPADFIPAFQYATEKGIPIASARGANAQAVAELTSALIHDRIRHVSYLSGEGREVRIRARNFRSLTLGIIGAGNIGSKVARIFNSAYGTKVIYYSRKRNLDLEFATGATFVSLDQLLSQADIVSFHVKRNPESINLINPDNIGLLKPGTVIINTCFPDAIDLDALYSALENQRLSVAFDLVFRHLENKNVPDFSKISSRYYCQMGSQTAYNTEETVEIASDIVTTAMINLLNYGNDAAVANSDFVKFKSKR